MTVTAMPATDPAAAAAPEKEGGKKKLLVVVAVLLVAAGAAYWFLLKPSGSTEEPPPEPGEVLTLDPIQVNLADGHYLKIGIALQLTKDAYDVSGAKALDATIALFSGREMSELVDATERKHLKDELLVVLEEKYEGKVMGVYFTDFVTQ